MKLREWQKKAIEYAGQNDHCIFQCATGTGKTVLVVKLLHQIMSEHPDSRVLIVVPKNVILEETWIVELREEFKLKHIGVFYGEKKDKSQITVTNMQSIEDVGYDEFDIVIFDELHNYMSDRMLGFLKRDKTRKIGLTATLQRDDYKHWEVLEQFDFNLFEYTLKQGVDDEVLSTFDFHNVGVSLDAQSFEEYAEIDHKIDSIESMSRDGKLDEVSKQQKYSLLDQRKRILGLNPKKFEALTSITRRLKGRKLIIFNEYNAAANDCYWNLLDNGFRPCIFNTSIPKKIRYKNLEQYRDGKFDVIITTRALDEGYNLPKIGAAIILCGGKNDRQMIQRAGRVLRKKLVSADIYQVYFRDTVEEEHAVKRYAIVKDSCEEYHEYNIEDLEVQEDDV